MGIWHRRPVTESPVLTRLYVKKFRCVESCELKLTRLHALVGPNDSGKSTLLRALLITQHSLSGALTAPTYAELAWSSGVKVQLGAQGTTWEPLPDKAARNLVEGRARVIRLDPDEMRKPASLIPSPGQLEFSERGAGLPAVYDALLARKRRAFDAIEQDVIRLFPQVESLVLLSVSSSEKQLGVQLKGKTDPVLAPELSEGMLYFLAFKALEYLSPARLLLIEEPENGLHPARIAELVSVLREVSKTTQVVMATHSPLVINELEANEVSVITRDDDGTHATLLSETSNYQDRASVYKNGEIWLSYSDGIQETELVKGTPSR
jgi:predicted ATPase